MFCLVAGEMFFSFQGIEGFKQSHIADASCSDIVIKGSVLLAFISLIEQDFVVSCAIPRADIPNVGKPGTGQLELSWLMAKLGISRINNFRRNLIHNSIGDY